MINTKWYQIYRDSFTGTISINDLVLVSTDNIHRYYKCPCGQNDHYATRVTDDDGFVGDGFANVVHCYERGKKWMIIETESEDNITRVKRIIRGEEEKFFKLLDEADNKIRQYMRKNNVDEITAHDLFVLHTTHGYDPSVVEGTVGTILRDLHDEYLLLMKQHKEISRVSHLNKVEKHARSK